MYHILGNMYNKDESNWVIVITSFKLDGYQHIKKTDIIDDVVVYQYNIKISGETNGIIIGQTILKIPNIMPTLNNTSVYFVSCDGQNTIKYEFGSPKQYYNVSDDTDMWKKLYIDIEQDTNIFKYVIHIGDQVYMDDAHDEIIKNGNTNNNDDAMRTYYGVYESNYTNKYKKLVLESAFNIMIQDDHETINDVCSIPNNLTQVMIACATKLYTTLQEDLYSIESHNIKYLRFTDFQIIIPDLRKYRKLGNDTSTMYAIIGEQQAKELDTIIKNTPISIKRNYYVNTIPFLSLNTNAINIFRKLTGYSTIYSDAYINNMNYYNERTYILNQLFNLDNVIIIGGDAHYAEYSTLTKLGKEIKHIVTSPISSDPIDIKNSGLVKFGIFALTLFMYEHKIYNIDINKKWVVIDYNYLKITNKTAKLCCYDETRSKTISLADDTTTESLFRPPKQRLCCCWC